MKTLLKGSIFNTLKRACGILMLFAVLLTSCDKYGDDFDALNDRLNAITTQITEASTLLAGISSLQTQVTNLQTAVSGLATADDLSSGLSDINDEIDEITLQLSNLDTSSTTIQEDIVSLSDQLADANASLKTLLASVNMYDGDIYITSDTEVDFYYPILSAWVDGGIIKGTVTIDATDITESAKLKEITDNIIAVIGGGSLFITNKVGDGLSFPNLTTVSQDFCVDGEVVDVPMLATVGRYVSLNYDGAYSMPNLTSAGSVILQDNVANDTTDPKLVGTTSVDFSGLTTCVDFGTSGGSGNIVVLALATDVKIGGGAKLIKTITASKATSVIYGIAKATVDLTITAADDAAVSLPSLTTAQALNVNAGTLEAPVVTEFTGAVSLTKTTDVSFPSLTTADEITAATATEFTAPKLVASANLILAAATDVEVASIASAELHAAVVTDLTVNALNTTLDIPGSVVTANITGKDLGTASIAANVVTSTGSAALVTLNVGGSLASASVDGATKLVTLKTTGTIDALTVDNCAIITALDLGHEHYAYGSGSDLTITNNPELLALETSNDYPKVITVTGNAKLAIVDFSTFVTPITNGSFACTMANNDLTANYTAYIASTGTEPSVPAVIDATWLVPIKNIVAATLALTTGTASITSVSININDVNAKDTPETLTSFMQADFTASGVGVTAPLNVVDDISGDNTTWGINSTDELALVK